MSRGDFESTETGKTGLTARSQSDIRPQKVRVDPGETDDDPGAVKKSLNVDIKDGPCEGVTRYHLDTAGCRAKCRDDGHNSKPKFVPYCQQMGQVGPGYASSGPTFPILGAVKPGDRNNYKAGFPDKYAGNYSVESFKGGPSSNAFFDPKDPAAYGEASKNLIPQSFMLKHIRDTNQLRGSGIRLVEGAYTKEKLSSGEEEQLTGEGTLELRTKGRAVVYEVIGLDGNIDVAGTYQMARVLAEQTYYDEIVLDYDNMDPLGRLNAQLIVKQPVITPGAQQSFAGKVTTLWNNSPIGDGEFLQLSPENN